MNTQAMKEARSAMNIRMFLLFLGIMLVMNAVMTTGRYGQSYLGIASAVEEAEKNGTLNLDEPLTEAAAQEPAAAESELQAGAGEGITEAATEIAPAADTSEPDLNELARQMKRLGITIGDLRMMGILSLIVAVLELAAGLICILFANRADRSKIVFIAILVLIAGEVVYLAYSAMKGSLVLTSLIYSLIIPLILLWQALKMRKIAKADPERVYLVPPAGRPAGGKKPGAGKNAQGAGTGSGRTGGSPTPIPGRSLHDRAMMRAEEQPPVQHDTEEQPPAQQNIEEQSPEQQSSEE